MQTIAEVKAFLETDARILHYARILRGDPRCVESAADAATIANALVEGWGYSPVNPRSWRILDQTHAREIATRLLSEDLAYKRELLRSETAAYVSRCLIRTLSPYTAQFVCNAEFFGSGYKWDPVGTGTFEVALIGFDEQQAFMLYAQAED